MVSGREVWKSRMWNRGSDGMGTPRGMFGRKVKELKGLKKGVKKEGKDIRDEGS